MFKFFKKKVKTNQEILSLVDYNIIFENSIVEETPIEIIDIGLLNVPSGKIVVCDPLVCSEAPALTKTVEPGKYPIKIYVAKTQDSGDRYAIAKLEFNSGRAEKWVMALREGENPNDLTDKFDFFGFPVDAGLGGFFDFQAGIEYQKFERDFLSAHPNANLYDDFFAAEFKKNAKDQNDPNDVGDWINFKLPNSELNITMFQSGYGDGMYPAYWGIDKSGKIVSLVIDFFVLLVPEDDEE